MRSDEPQAGSSEMRRLEVPDRLELAARVGALLVLAMAVVLRAIAKSPLWLDEALTVNIAKAPLSELPRLLRDDGAPPLYYVLLHFWMKLFGTSDFGARSLSGLIGLVNLPVAWVTGYRVGSRWWTLDEASPAERVERESRGRTTAWAMTLLLASSPFAVYYDTEARMYGLMLLLGTLGVLAVTSLLRRPGWRTAAMLALLACTALYTHYWALYGCGILGVGALWCAIRGPHREAGRYAVGALVVAGFAFLPWLPTFLFQLRHTGTPWSVPAQYIAIVSAFTQLAGGTSTTARALTLVFFFLFVLAIFGLPVDRNHVLLDLRTRPGVRAVAAAVVATLIVAVVAGKLSGSAFADRYTAIIVGPALLVFAYGLTMLSDVRVRYGVLALSVALGIGASLPNLTQPRTEAGPVAAVIEKGYRGGDVVAYCPDQLGPSVSRLLGGGYDQITFPRDAPPQIVDWVNYKATVAAASPENFVRLIERRAGAHTIWYVFASGYEGFGDDCSVIAELLAARGPERVVVAMRSVDEPLEIYEGMSLARVAYR